MWTFTVLTTFIFYLHISFFVYYLDISLLDHTPYHWLLQSATKQLLHVNILIEPIWHSEYTYASLNMNPDLNALLT